MAVNPNNAVVQLGTSNTTVLAAATNQQVLVLRAKIVNTSASAATFNLYVIPSAGTPSASTQMFSAFAVGVNETVDLNLGGVTLINGQSIVATASAATSLTVSIFYQSAP